MIDDTRLFAGLDTVPWGRMKHAYGRAGGVPELIRGLADADPAVREQALDAMYGAVHHQGDVYRCTVEAIPFLLRICGSDRPGRDKVVELVASIGGGSGDGHLRGLFGQARELVTARFPFWCALAVDDEPAVRAAAVNALRSCRSRGSDAALFLRARYADEPDPAVRAAIVAAVADLGRARHAAGVAGWVADLLASEPDARVRLTLFAELNTLPAATGRLGLAAALDLVDAGYAEHGEPPVPAGFSTPTLIGALRERRESVDRHRSRAALDGLVRAVANSFGDRVDERTALLAHLLAADDWERRLDAMYPALNLAQGWRGSYGNLARLVGEQLTSPYEELRRRAVSVLSGFGCLAAPAADALADVLACAAREATWDHDDRHTAWVVRWARGLPTLGPVPAALAGVGDARVLPVLAWALEQEATPRNTGYLIAGLGERAADLVPLVRRRLATLPDGDERIVPLASALRSVGPRGVEALPELLAKAPDRWTLAAIGSFGQAAADALPLLHRVAAAEDHRLAPAAAVASWRVDGDAARAASWLTPYLAGDVGAVRNAAEALAEIGTAEPAAVTALRRLLRRRDTAAGWLHVDVARALWRVTGDMADVQPVLTRQWHAHPLTRTTIVRVWAAMGPAAADCLPLLQEELAEVRRLSARNGIHSGDPCTPDEVYLDEVRATVRRLTGAP
ncbi:HEAT repeat domain-containing protein [Catellatospora vulcania]|uniref:HEAT repeat domain-containing protein n=1 Tax=Catellatospora vulcania TaxID=1460450 RepID=UPI0018AFFE5B|nr:HEAT repeat domain-containing protein [Catellatospora vulcania]